MRKWEKTHLVLVWGIIVIIGLSAASPIWKSVSYDSANGNAIRTLMDARAGLLLYGTSVAVDTDARFSDARTPTAHTQSYTTITGLGSAATQPDTYFEPAISGDPDTSKYWRADKTWQTVVGGGGGDMYKADNLSGLADAATARGNLGLGTASTHADTEYEDAGALSGHESTYNHANYDTAYSKVNADSASWDAKQSALTSGGDGTAILDGVKIRSLKNSAGITWYTGGDSIRGEVAAVSSGHDILDSAGNTLETTTGIKFMSPFTSSKNGDNAEIGLSTLLDFDSQFYVASTTQTVTHNFGNIAVDATIYDVATNKRILPDVTFTDANNLSVDMTGWGNRTIRVYVKRPGTTSSGGGGGMWELVERKEFTETSSSYNFTGISGDTDRRYRFACRIISATDGNSDLYVRPQSDTGSNYQSREMQAYGTNTLQSSSQALTYAPISLLRQTGTVAFVRGEIDAATGCYRLLDSEDIQQNDSTSLSTVSRYATLWKDSSTNITSLQFAVGEAKIGVGSYIELWKLSQ